MRALVSEGQRLAMETADRKNHGGHDEGWRGKADAGRERSG